MQAKPAPKGQPMLPYTAIALVEELAKSIPARCIRANESLEAAHRYAGQRDLIESLLLRLAATVESDPEKPILKKA